MVGVSHVIVNSVQNQILVKLPVFILINLLGSCKLIWISFKELIFCICVRPCVWKYMVKSLRRTSKIKQKRWPWAFIDFKSILCHGARSCIETLSIFSANTRNWIRGHKRANIVLCQWDIKRQSHTHHLILHSATGFLCILSYPRESHNLYLAGTKDTVSCEDCT